MSPRRTRGQGSGVAGERGAVATEYVFLATLVGLVIVAAATFLGEQLRDVLDAVGGML